MIFYCALSHSTQQKTLEEILQININSLNKIYKDYTAKWNIFENSGFFLEYEYAKKFRQYGSYVNSFNINLQFNINNIFDNLVKNSFLLKAKVQKEEYLNNLLFKILDISLKYNFNKIIFKFICFKRSLFQDLLKKLESRSQVTNINHLNMQISYLNLKCSNELQEKKRENINLASQYEFITKQQIEHTSLYLLNLSKDKLYATFIKNNIYLEQMTNGTRSNFFQKYFTNLNLYFKGIGSENPSLNCGINFKINYFHNIAQELQLQITNFCKEIFIFLDFAYDIDKIQYAILADLIDQINKRENIIKKAIVIYSITHEEVINMILKLINEIEYILNMILQILNKQNDILKKVSIKKLLKAEFTILNSNSIIDLFNLIKF
jgi:hypothetical protein